MSREFRHILRITDTDVDGTLKVPYALRKIKGISLNLANVIAVSYTHLTLPTICSV